MAECKTATRKTYIITLALTTNEAKALMALMQNPITENDPSELTQVRSAIFNSLRTMIYPGF